MKWAVADEQSRREEREQSRPARELPCVRKSSTRKAAALSLVNRDAEHGLEELVDVVLEGRADAGVVSGTGCRRGLDGALGP